MLMGWGNGLNMPNAMAYALASVPANRVGAAFNRLTQAEWWARQATGAVLLLIGFYLTLHHVWRVV